MREQLDQVKQEKLAALMRLAEANGAAASPARSDSAKNDGSPLKSPGGGSGTQPASSPSPQRRVGWWGSSPVKG